MMRTLFLETSNYEIISTSARNKVVPEKRGEDFFEGFWTGRDYEVYEPDKAKLRLTLSMGEILKTLEASDVAIYEYRLMKRGMPSWHKLKITYADRQEGKTLVARIVETDHLKENSKTKLVMDAFAERYSMVLRADLENNRAYLYKHVRVPKAILSKLNEEGFSYEESLIDSINEFVLEEDRERLIETIRPANIIKELADKQVFQTNFRSLADSGLDYYELTIRRLYAGGEVRECIISAVKSEEVVLKKLASEKIMGEFYSVYVLNLANGRYRNLQKGDVYGVDWGQSGYYEEQMANEKPYIHPEDWSVFQSISTIDKVKEILKHNDGAELTYRTGNPLEPWEKCILRIIDRVGGDPINAILAFAKVEDIDAHKLQQRIEEIKEKNIKLQRINEDIINLLGNLTEARDSDSGKHIIRVRELTGVLSKQIMKDWPEYGIDDERVRIISYASILHDVGKIKIPDAILLKPGRFLPEEMEQMKKHTLLGYEIIENAPIDQGNEYLSTCKEIARWHHERYDGGGYPDGLKGDDIPISAQIVSLVDCLDALTSNRIYRDAYSPRESYSIINSGQCGAFSPKLKESFNKCFDELIEVINGIKKWGGKTATRSS